MKEQHVLLDYENVQPSLDELAKLAPGYTDVWLFHGPHQDKQAQLLAAAHARVTPVPRSGKGPNALDFHLSFYLGYVAAKHPDAQLVVIANDQGYDPMIEHATQVLGFHVQRVGFKAGKAAAVKKAVPARRPAVLKPPAPVSKAAPTKKVVVAKVPAPAKKAAAKKTVAQKVATKKTPTSKTAAKVVAPAAVVKQAPAKKASAKAATPAKKAAPPKAAVAADTKAFERIKKGLAKMGDKRPHKRKPFLRHLESMLGQTGTPAALEAMVKKLEQQNVVHIAGDLVLYS